MCVIAFSVSFVRLKFYHTTPALCLFVMSAISSAICLQLTTVRKIVRQQNRRSSVNKALTLVDSSTQGINMRNRTISVCQLAPVFRKKTYEFCNKTGHAINTRTSTIYSICLWTGYEGNSKFILFQDVNELWPWFLHFHVNRQLHWQTVGHSTCFKNYFLYLLSCWFFFLWCDFWQMFH